MKKIVTIVGARPQFIKAAVLSRLIRSKKYCKKFQEVLVHSGQHYDQNMSDIFFEEMEIPKPYYNLNVGSGTHGKMTGTMLIKIEEVLLKEKPDFVLVYGDTNSTLAGALAASKLHIPIAHVEAGLRSFWKKMPEEQNRILTDHLSDFLLCPTETAINNLSDEGIKLNVINVGDIMLDAHRYYSNKLNAEKDTLLEKMAEDNQLDIKKGDDFYLLTIHRAENTDDPIKLGNIVNALNAVEKEAICPMHPRTLKQLEKFNLTFKPHIKIIKPVGYLEMLTLQSECEFVVTDSGGVQKEAFFSNKKCITLREQTEWIETLENNNNILCGTDKDKIVTALNGVNQFCATSNLFGDGNTGELILDILTK